MTYIESGMGHITSIKSISDNFHRLYGDQFDIDDCYIMKEDGDKVLMNWEKFVIKQTQRTNKVRGYGNFVFGIMTMFGGVHFLRATHRTIFLRACNHMIKAFEKRNPDIIVSTHYFITYCALEYKRKYNKNVKVVTYNPDNNVHCWWDNREHLFIVNNESAYYEAIGKRKFNPATVKQVKFTARDEIINANGTKEEYREKFGIPQDKFCVIVADGAYAMGKAKDVVDELLKSDKEMTILFLAGKNQKLFNKYTALKDSGKIKSNINLVVLPFKSNIYEYYRASDLFITKAGPNAILDSVFMNTPIIADYYAHPIEKATKNLFVNDLGVGLYLNKPKKIKKAVEYFIDNPDKLEPYIENTKKIDKHNNGGELAAKYIYEESLRKEIFATRSDYTNYLYELASEEKFDTFTTPINYNNQKKNISYDKIKNKGILSKVYSKIVKGTLKIFGPIINHLGFGIKVKGKKNLKGVKSGITISNHVHQLDCLWNMEALYNKKVYITGAPHNFKEGFFGATMEAGGFIPLTTSFSESKKFSEYISSVLKEGGFIHFYPEQALWYKYEQSRPFKKGAFYYASQNNVPIIPIIICFRKSLFHKTAVTLNICKPIYPDENLSAKENCEMMLKKAQSVYDNEIIKFYKYDEENYSMTEVQKRNSGKEKLKETKISSKGAEEKSLENNEQNANIIEIEEPQQKVINK